MTPPNSRGPDRRPRQGHRRLEGNREASTAAKKRIGDFLDGVHLTIAEIGHIEAVLDLSRR